MGLLALGWFWHPLHGLGYQFWSGAGSDVGELSIFVALLAFARHRVCHVDGCWRLGHSDPEHGWPACKRHHTHAHKLGKVPPRGWGANPKEKL